MGTQLTNLTSRRWLSISIAVVLVLLPFHALLTTWAGANFGHINAWRLWAEVLVLAVSLPLAAHQLRDASLRTFLRKSPITWLFLIYLCISGILAVWSLGHRLVNKEALAEGLDLNLRFIGFFFICLLAASKDDFLKRWWPKLVLYPAALVVLFGVVQKTLLPANFLSHFGYGPKTIPAFQTVDAHSGPARLQSTLRGPNPLGAYLTLIVPVALVAFWRRRWQLVLASAASAGVLFYSYSRSAELATVVASSMLILWLTSRRQRSWILAASVAVALVATGILYGMRHNQFVQESLLHTSAKSTSEKTSNGVRLSSLKSGWHDLVKQPLGRGPGTAGPASEHNQPYKARISENYYLQLGQELGIEGLLIFVAINILVALKLWQERAENLPKVLLVTLLGISFINMLSHAWTDDTLAMLWWGLAGIALTPNILKNKSKI